jgi:hypothetical protein
MLHSSWSTIHKLVPASMTPCMQGTADNFLASQLRPENLEKVAKEVGYPLELRMQVSQPLSVLSQCDAHPCRAGGATISVSGING